MLTGPARRTLHSRSARRVCRAPKPHRSSAAVRGCALLGLAAPRCSPPTAGGNQQLPVNRPPHGREKYQSVSAYRPLQRRATPTETTFCCPWQQSVRKQSVVADIPCPRTGRGLALSAHFVPTAPAYSSRCPQTILAFFIGHPVLQLHAPAYALVLSLVRMITFDQPSTAREAVPDDCTARFAPSRSSSLRCGQPLTALASANGLAPKISRAGNSLLATEPEDIQKHVQQKSELFLQT
jgi:hypothetical protein